MFSARMSSLCGFASALGWRSRDSLRGAPEQVASYRHTAARQCEHDYIRAIGIGPELSGQHTTGFNAISKSHFHKSSPLSF
jgi:hypothetical protein